MQKSKVSLTKSQLEKQTKKVNVEKKEVKLTQLEKDIVRIVKDFSSESGKDDKTDRKSLMKDFKVCSVVESTVTLDNKKTEKVILVYVNFTALNTLRTVASDLIKRIEEKRKQKVLFTVKRNIESKFVKLNRKQQKPRSRTLISVFDNVLEDLVLPGFVTGRRMRHRADGSLFYRIYVNKESEEELSNKVEVISKVYQKLTGRFINIDFYTQQNYFDIKKTKK